jgi:hypothetical protein
MDLAPRKPVLLVAAESIALASGMVETVADVVRTRALRHYGEGLRQYLAIQLRSAGLAERAMHNLRERLTRWSSGALLVPPGPRAHLYRIARELVATYESEIDEDSCDLPWIGPQKMAGQSYANALTRLREELAREDAELLELHHARELTLEELAHVLAVSVASVEQALERAHTRALRMLGSAPPSRLGGLPGAIQEAFALGPALEVHRAPASASVDDRTQRGLPEGTLIGERYAVQQRVGEGSFGDVYRALDADVPGHVVALKLLHRPSPSEEARKTALRELRLIASVFHPSVVDFKDHGWYDDRLWFVMPWYDGETLEDRIKREPLTREEAQEIFTALAQALATMHAAGIRHQDIKPDNIFLARIGEVGKARARTLPVLIDLGVAAKDAEMIVAGTPLYFPPEIAAQYANEAYKPKVTAKADVFSLALALRNALEPGTQEQVPGTAIEAFITHRANNPPVGPTARALSYHRRRAHRRAGHPHASRASARASSLDHALVCAHRAGLHAGALVDHVRLHQRARSLAQRAHAGGPHAHQARRRERAARTARRELPAQRADTTTAGRAHRDAHPRGRAARHAAVARTARARRAGLSDARSA